MEKLVNRLIEKSKPEDIDKFGHTKQLMKFERNRLFKGHAGSISYGMYEDKTSHITMMNQYYDSWVYFKYNFESNKSELSITVNAMPTKYMMRFYNNITDNGKLFLKTESPTGIYDNKSELYIDQYGGVTITNTLFFDEFVAFGHYENIQIVDQARTLMKRFKSIIREKGSSKDFCNKVRFVKEDDVYIAESLYT